MIPHYVISYNFYMPQRNISCYLHILLLGTSTGIQEFQDIMQAMQHQEIDLFMASLVFL